jgi:hypothetical protein
MDKYKKEALKFNSEPLVNNLSFKLSMNFNFKILLIFNKF